MLAALLVATAGAASSCLGSEPPTPAGLLLAESRWVTAIEQRDSRALACRLAPRFTDSNWRGDLVERAAILAALPTRPPSNLALSELAAEVQGSVGIVHGINTQTSIDGKTIGRVRFTDVFVRAGGRWQALCAQETLIGSADGGDAG